MEAEGLVHGPRDVDYGSPVDAFERTAGMLTAMLRHKLLQPLTPQDVGMILCCVKLSRQAYKPKRDNMTDLAGYAECIQWIEDG